jgi:hypothetical protein
VGWGGLTFYFDFELELSVLTLNLVSEANASLLTKINKLETERVLDDVRSSYFFVYFYLD